ncbi:MAG: HTH domain-containing protein [Candidatus Zixiibacteriota bacterium]|nr:MAG: HTH domain-containing protein [candidate division Zixibacteria bacterium]
MGKLNRVLRLINLLTHRQQVTLETIKKTCGIPERTAYRYLKDISEANFPVYFDRNSRAYRLDRYGSSPRMDDFSLEEAVLIIVALKRLAGSINPDYRQEVSALSKKILVSQSIPLEEIFEAYEHQLESLSDQQECSQLISSILISSAIRFGRRVKLTVNSGTPYDKAVSIENPALRFKKHWQLVSGTESDSEAAEFPRIKKVSLVRP